MDGASADCSTKQLKSLTVHYSSGPAHHCFYLRSEGSGAKTINGIASNSRTCNGSTVTGIALAEALGALGLILPKLTDVVDERAGVDGTLTGLAATGLVAIQALAIPTHLRRR